VAKGGGGSWKVAYADFVTAMMAFFLVMWIGAQDVKVRQSVANYFVDPSGVSKAQKSGGMMPDPSPGAVPKRDAVTGGQGTRQPAGKEPNRATAAVLSWIKETPDRHQHWKEQALAARAEAARQNVGNQAKSPDEIANDTLAHMLSSELADGLPPQLPEVYKRIVIESLSGVDWSQVAGDILNT
jgi:flagellar motor protein MotB